MAGNIKGIIVEIGGDTSALQKALSKVNSQSSSLSKELKGINSLLKLDPKNTELLSQKQTVLNENIAATQDKLTQLKKIKEEADEKMSRGTKISEENYRNLQREIINTERKLNNLTNDLKQFVVENSNWTKAGKKIDEYGDKIIKVSKKVDDIGNKASVVSGTVVAGGIALTNSAMNLDDAVSKYVSTTNTAKEETEQYKEVLENIYRNNYGEGYEDIANAMSNVKMQLKDLNGQDLQNVTEKAIAFRDLFGYEVSESIRAVKAMMDNFNISSDEAFNLLAEGKKQGLDFSNELLDNVNEYSVQFKKLGLTADDMFNIFKSGAENGAFNLDKIGDAVKEFSIRAIDGSNTTIEGFKKLGLNANTMAKKFAQGGDTAKQAFIQVVEKIGKMDNKVEQSIVGVDLFGTMWEDLGPTVVTSFSKMDKGISKSSNSMQDSIDGLYDTTKKKAEAQLRRLQSLGADFGKEMLPTLEKIIDKAEDFIKSLESMSDAEKENILKIGLFVAGMGPATKVLGTAGKVIGTTTKGIGTFSKAVGLMGKTSTDAFNNASKGTQILAKGLTGLTSPAGIATLAITTAVTAIAIAIKNSEKETKEAFSNMGKGATDFITGIQNANSHLDSFNSTLFASSEEQQKLQDEMSNIQNGITGICKTASDERRGYTQEEITQLDEYFKKLRELKNKEIEIQESVSKAITQYAQQNAQNFQGTTAEYKIQADEMLKTATEQKDNTIKLIEDGTIQQIALLNERYKTEEERKSEAFQNEYNSIVEQQQQKIDLANQEVTKVAEAYNNGYTERVKQNEGWYSKLVEANGKTETENERHTSRLQEIQEKYGNSYHVLQTHTTTENEKHKGKMKEIWDEMSKNMSNEEQEELGSWLLRQAHTEMYGGEISEENQKMVDTVLDSYEKMPKETRQSMKDAMQPMLEEMEKKEPSLFAKALNIGNGICERLKKAFDEHSPSKRTRKIFKYAMEGAELGLQDEEKKLYRQIDKVAENTIDKFNNIDIANLKINIPKAQTFDKIQGSLKNKVIENTKTIFTTPQIVFNVQELDEAKLQQCFNYINKKFGSEY